MKRLFAFLLLTASGGVALAQEKLGVQSHDCQNWTASHSKAALPFNATARAAYRAWVLGFVSGVNTGSNTELLQEVDHTAVLRWLDGFCADNPTETISSAARSLVAELRTSGGKVSVQTTRSSVVDGATLVVPSDEVLADGRTVYLKNCAACHQANGRGVAGMFKSLVSPTIAIEKVNTVRAIMYGGGVMPAYWRSLSIQEISAAANYVQHSWGNRSTVLVEETDIVQGIKAR